ncbi:MAG: G5 domain-containing protein [Oscillospiraceae bacterium]|nr:G5 domain-containing protein [Oscillospiraceae bacterium]
MDKLIKNALIIFEVVKSRAFTVSLFAVMLALIVFKVTDMANVVSIVDGAQTRVCYTLSDDPEEILAGNGVVTLAFDAVDVSELDGKLTEITVNRAFPAYVEADGQKKKVMVTGGTVEELLSKADIELNKYDEVDTPLDEEVAEGTVVTVTRKYFLTVHNREKLPHETVVSYSPDVAAGTEEVLVEGESGMHVETVQQLVVDGEVVEETVKGSEVEREPVTEVVVKGFPVQPVSDYDFELQFDENCEPVDYASVLREQKSAGYSAPSGAGTASGLKAVVGHVAVDPKVIPYGTKLFIKSSDGKHIYGYAIAADTGTALKQGLITVDLFYDTYEESARNGIRKVDIFILEDKNEAEAA